MDRKGSQSASELKLLIELKDGILTAQALIVSNATGFAADWKKKKKIIIKIVNASYITKHNSKKEQLARLLYTLSRVSLISQLLHALYIPIN